MADSNVQIKITADAEDAKRSFADMGEAAKRSFEDVESSASRAMEAGRRAAEKMEKEMDALARQIKGVVAGMASMAASIASSALKNSGHETAASYLGAASSGAQSLATSLAPLGGGAMLAGAAAGALIGAGKNYFEQDAAGDQQAEAMRKLADAMQKAREETERAHDRTEAFAKTLQTIGDESADATSRENLRAEKIKSLQDEIDAASKRMEFAEQKLRENAHHDAGEQMTKEQQDLAASLEQIWKDSARAIQTARGELKALEAVQVDKRKPGEGEPANDRVANLLSGLEKAGIGFAALETNNIADKHAKGWGFRTGDVEGVGSVRAPEPEKGEEEPPAPDTETKTESPAPEPTAPDTEEPAPKLPEWMDDFSKFKLPGETGEEPEPQEPSPAEAFDASVSEVADKFAAAADAFSAANETERFDDKTTAAVEDGNDIAEQQLAVLERIESKTTGTAVFA